MNKDAPSIYEFDGYLFNEINRTFFYHGVEIRLTKRNFDVLQLLIEKNGAVVSKTEFFETVWADTFVEDGNLAVSITALRKIFETHSNSTFIETVPRRGYKFTASVKKIYEDEPEPNKIELETNTISDDKSSQSTRNQLSANQFEGEIEPAPKIKKSSELPHFFYNRKLQMLFALLLSGFFTFGVYSLYLQKTEKKGVAIEHPRTVVLPFTNLKPDPATDYLNFAFSETVGNAISEFGRYELIRVSALPEGKSVDELIKDYKTNQNIDLVVVGTYIVNANDIEISTRLINTHGNDTLFTKSFVVPNKDISSVPRQISSEIVRSLGFDETVSSVQMYIDPSNLDEEAYRNYLRALNFRFQELEAIPFAEKAVQIEPEFYNGWLLLSFHYRVAAQKNNSPNIDYYEKAIKALQTAQKINPDEARPRIALGYIYTETNRTEEALREFKSLSDNKTDQAGTFQLGAYFCRYAGLLDESIAFTEKSNSFNKTSGTVNAAYFYKGDFNSFQNSIPADSESSVYAWFHLGLISLHQNDEKEIRKRFQLNKLTNVGDLYSEMSRAILLHLDGKTGEGLEILKKIEKTNAELKYFDSENHYFLVLVYSYLGDKEGAIRAFKKSVEGGFFCYPYFLNESLLDKLRDDERFKEVLETARQRHEKFKELFYAKD